MTISADFTIEADPSANLGYDATNSQVLTLQLEATPTAEVGKVVFSVAQKSKDAPALVFSPVSGEPATPGGTVDVTMPSSGTHSYALQCQINNGINADADNVAAWTRYRMVSIRSPNTLRKMVPAETTEYEAPDGWTAAFNEMIDYLDGLTLTEGRYGEMYLSAAADTTISTVNTPVKLAGTTTEGDVEGFEMTADNRLSYTGAGTIYALVNVCTSIKAVSGTDFCEMHIYKNGTLVPGSTVQWRTSSSPAGNQSSCCLVPMTTNDYLEVWVENITGTENFRAESLTMTAVRFK